MGAFEWVSQFTKDVRYGLRQLLRNPGFTLVSVFTLALAIGANTAIFSVVNSAILRPLPYPDPEEMVGIGQWRNQKGVGYVQTGLSPANWKDVQQQNRVFQWICSYRFADFDLTSNGTLPELEQGARIPADFLPMLGIEPSLGRNFTKDEDEPGHNSVAIISNSLWHEHYGSDPHVLGKILRLDGKPYTVVGVMPANFHFIWDAPVKVFVPLALTPQDLSEAQRGSRDLETIARMKPRVTFAQAQANLDTIAASLAARYPSDKGWGLKVEPLHSAYLRWLREPLYLLLGAVLLVLLIGCANVANLMLARSITRQREMAMRLAMGASRGRLIRQLLTESMLIGVAGGVLAIFGSIWMVAAMAHAVHDAVGDDAALNHIVLDGHVLAFALILSIITGLLFGLAPALETSRSRLNETLKESGTAVTSASGTHRLRTALVIGEVAIAMVLAVTGGLLVRSFARMLNVNLGYNPYHVLTFYVTLPKSQYPDATSQINFYRQTLQRLRALPGVQSAALTNFGSDTLFLPEGRPRPAPGQEPEAQAETISADYFETLQASIIQGRAFTESDDQAGVPAAILNETAAKRYWPGTNPVGQHITLLTNLYGTQATSAPKSLQIVGIVRDVRIGFSWRNVPYIYIPALQQPHPTAMFLLRTAPPPMTLVKEARAAVAGVDANRPVAYVQTLEENAAREVAFVRFPMILVWCLAGLALFLSAAGIFGVMAYSVSQRTHEMAIRMALGARQADVLRMVLRQGLAMALAGGGLGMIGAVACGRLISSYLYKIRPFDPVTLISVTAFLAAISLLACYIPARRATKVDPMVALRYE
jgi:putative ABC transport system permease protein